MIDPFAVAFPFCLMLGLPLKKMTPVFFFFPASATALNAPITSAAVAKIASSFIALIGHPPP